MRQALRQSHLFLAGLVAVLNLLPVPVARAETNTPATDSPPASDRLQSLRSPVELFRELLAMTPEEREANLARRSPETRQRILEKLREYELLPPDERELRLRSTELRWYLLPLMSTAITNPSPSLEHVPEELRGAARDRLLLWSITPPPLREELMENDEQLQLYLQLEASSPAQKTNLLRSLPAGKRAAVEAGFDHWRALSPEERRMSLDRVSQYFELTAVEKARVLNTLSEPERRQMDATLRAFEQLPPEARAICIRSYAKFAGLSPAEQQAFLQKAERWQAMTPGERQAWRDLVRVMPIWPPEPPDFTGTPVPPMPPMPPLVSPEPPATSAN